MSAEPARTAHRPPVTKTVTGIRLGQAAEAPKALPHKGISTEPAVHDRARTRVVFVVSDPGVTHPRSGLGTPELAAALGVPAEVVAYCRGTVYRVDAMSVPPPGAFVMLTGGLYQVGHGAPTTVHWTGQPDAIEVWVEAIPV